MKQSKIRYYKSFSEDFTVSKNQAYTLPGDYKWVDKSIKARLLSKIVYAVAVAASFIYCKLILHMNIKGKEKLKSVKGGFFIYGNHTQPVGDVFIPAHCAFPKRIYTIVSTANYGIPFIGKILPYLGALPIDESIGGMRRLNDAIAERVENGNPIVIFPEAHVWEYCTFIRDFPSTAFKYPAKLAKPAFAMTVCYNKSRFFKKPKMNVWLDGPFYAVGDTQKEKAERLHKSVHSAMLKRSKTTDIEYIKYRPEQAEKNNFNFFEFRG